MAAGPRPARQGDDDHLTGSIDQGLAVRARNQYADRTR
jgi:hypothetical protein